MDLRSDIGRGVLWTEFGGAWTESSWPELLDHEALGQSGRDRLAVVIGL